MSSNELCSICMEEMVTNCVVSYCNHKFHKSCIGMWGDIKKEQEQRPCCPICRYKPLVLVEDLSLKEIRKAYVRELLEREDVTKRLKETIEVTSAMLADAINERNTFQNNLFIIMRENEILKNKMNIIKAMLIENSTH